MPIGIIGADRVGSSGAILLAVVVVGAIGTHIRTGDGPAKIAAPALLLILLVIDTGIIRG